MIEPLLDTALELEGDARSAFLDDACADDTALRRQLDVMLAECEEPTTRHGMVDSPAYHTFRSLDIDSESDAAFAAALSDRYAMDAVVGRGGMGVVYRARDLRHERTVAIKVLRADASNSRTAARFLREIRVTAGLRHPRLLPLYDSAEIAGRVYYVMPFVAGGTLRDRMDRETPVSIDDAMRMIRDVAEALAYAHDSDVLHRDVKPENILLDDSGAVLADFGVASAIARATGVGASASQSGNSTLSAFGTPAYMAPEQLTTGAAVDHRADLFALGVVAYELMGGVHPFPHRAHAEPAVTAVVTPPERLRVIRPEIGPALDALVLKLIECSPDDRPPSAEYVVRAIDGMRAEHPRDVTALERRTDIAADAPAPRARRIGRLIAASAIVATVVLVWRLQPPRDAARLASSVAGSGAPVRVTSAPLTGALDSGESWVSQRGVDPRPAPTRLITRVLLMPLVNSGREFEEGKLAQLIGQRIEIALLTMDSVEVVSPSTSVIGRDTSLRAIAERSGAQVMIAGTYATDADSLHVAASVTDVGRWRVVASVPSIATTRDAPQRLLEPLLQRLLAAVAVAGNLDPEQASDSMPPALYAAISPYVRGLESFPQTKWKEADPYFAKAWALDSSLVPAAMSAVDANIIEGRTAAADSILAAIERRRATLSIAVLANVDRQRGAIDGDWVKELAGARAYAQAMPEYMIPRMFLAQTALRAGFPREALVALRTIQSMGGPAAKTEVADDYWARVAAAHHVLGDYASERAAMATARALRPDSWIAVSASIRAFVALGQVDSARTGMWVLRYAASSIGDARVAYSLVGIALECNVHGHGGLGREALRLALDTYASREPDAQLSLSTRPGRAYAHYLLGNFAVADSLLRHFERYAPGNRSALLTRGLVAARRGNRAEGARIGALLGSTKPRYDHGQTSYMQARLAAAMGDMPLALGLLTRARKEGLDYSVSLHRDPEFAPLHSNPQFQSLLRPRG